MTVVSVWDFSSWRQNTRRVNDVNDAAPLNSPSSVTDGTKVQRTHHAHDSHHGDHDGDVQWTWKVLHGTDEVFGEEFFVQGIEQGCGSRAAAVERWAQV